MSFSLYINDVTKDIDSEIRLFANDCVCYREIKYNKNMVKRQEDTDRFFLYWARSPTNQIQYNADYKKLINKINAPFSFEGKILDNKRKSCI